VELFSVNLDSDRNLIDGHHGCDLCVADGQDSAFAALELTLDRFASVTNLNLELGVIAYSLHDSLVLEDVPLVDVRAVATTLVCDAHVKLEASHLVQHRTHVLMGQLGDCEFVIKESISEHKVFPDVDFFAE